MKSFTNDVVNNWRVELDQDSTLRQFMPMLNFTLDNSGDSEVKVFLHGESVGSCYGYATFAVMGKPFESFRIEGVFNIGDLTVNVSKMETVTAMPFNPQIDLMEENLDKFASGTDSRVSYSSTMSTTVMKYLINVQNGLIVQRKLDVLGGASVGSYEIDFGGDIVSGSTAINFPSVDLKRYKKTISNSSFSHTLTNCSIAGWIIDYYKNPNDISPYYTIVDGTNTENSYDDDLSTFSNDSTNSTSFITVWEVSFSERDISSIHTKFINSAGSSTASTKIQLECDSVWTDSTISTAEGTFYKHDNTGYEKVTGIRYQLKNSLGGAYTSNLKVYDVSAFE